MNIQSFISSVAGGPELHQAVRKGDLKKVHELLGGKTNVNYVDSRPMIGAGSPLHVASSLNYYNIAIALIRGGAAVDVKDKDGRTPLHIAAKLGYVQTAMELLKANASVQETDPQGHIALHFAVKNGHKDMVHELLMHGSDPNKGDVENMTSVHYGAILKDSICMGMLLRSPVADPNVCDSKGKTPLHHAIKYGVPPTTALLLQSGARSDALDKRQRTPLHIGAAEARTDQVKVLCEFGAMVNCRDAVGNTPLHCVVQISMLQHMTEWGGGTNRTHIINTLIQYGADVNAVNEVGQTALHTAADSDQKYSLLVRLLELGANPRILDTKGSKASMIAQTNKAKKNLQVLQVYENKWQSALSSRGQGLPMVQLQQQAAQQPAQGQPVAPQQGFGWVQPAPIVPTAPQQAVQQQQSLSAAALQQVQYHRNFSPLASNIPARQASMQQQQQQEQQQQQQQQHQNPIDTRLLQENEKLKKELEELKKQHTAQQQPPQASPSAPEAVDDSDIPQYFICPITQDIMNDPVIAADGYTYDRSVIEAWLQRHQTSPMTNLPLPNTELTPNRTLKGELMEWQQKHTSQ